MSAGDSEVSVNFMSKGEAAVWQAFQKLVNAGQNAANVLQDAGGKATKLSSSLASFAKEIQRIPTQGVDTLATKLQKVQELLAKKVITPELAAAAEKKFRSEDEATKARQKDESLAPLKRFAEEQVKIDTTPLEKAQASWHRLREAVANGLMTEQQFARASSRIHSEYAASVAKTAEAQQRLQQAKATAGPDPMTPDPASLAAWNEQVRAIKAADDEMKRFADDVRRVNATPAERLTAQMTRLNAALRSGKLSQEDFGRASRRAQEEYRDELRKTEGAQGGVSQSFDSLATGIASRLVGMVGVARMVQAVLGEMKQAADDAARSVQTSREGMGALAQFDPSQFGDLQKQARDLRSQGAADSIDSAAKMLFAMKSAGAEKSDIDTFAKLSKFGVVSDSAGMARSASALQTALGKDQAGTFADIVGRALTASKYTPATAEALVQGAAKAGSFARTQGVGAESLLAGTAILSSAKGSAEEGGSRIAALLRQTSQNKKLRGLDLGELVDTIAAKNLPPEKLTKMLGDSEAIDAFQILSRQREDLRKAMADFASNRGRDPIAERLRMAESDPAIAAAARLREAEGRLEVARVPLGVERTSLQSTIEAARLRVEKTQGSDTERGLKNALLTGLQVAGGIVPTAVQNTIAGKATGTGFLDSFTTDMLGRRMSLPGNTNSAFGALMQSAFPTGERSAIADTPSFIGMMRGFFSGGTSVAREQMEAAKQMKEAAQALSEAVQPRQRVDRWGPAAQAQHSRAAE